MQEMSDFVCSVRYRTVLIHHRLLTQWPSSDCGKDFTLWYFVALNSRKTECESKESGDVQHVCLLVPLAVRCINKLSGK